MFYNYLAYWKLSLIKPIPESDTISNNAMVQASGMLKLIKLPSSTVSPLLQMKAHLSKIIDFMFKAT